MTRQEIERLLPDVFQRTCTPGTPLYALLETMSALHEPPEQVLQQLDMICDPMRTPDAFVPFLARWVDLERIFDPTLVTGAREPEVPISTGLGRLRELTVAAGTLTQWRGTRRGLLLFLTTATGLDGFEVNEKVIGEDGHVLPFHIEVVAPAAAEPHRTLLERIVKQEKPAYVTCCLRFGNAEHHGRS
jgi:phage tail-like protein